MPEAASPPLKLPKMTSSVPSTSSENAASSIQPAAPVIKTEPPGDDMPAEDDYRARDDNEDAYDNLAKSPSHYEGQDKSPPLDTGNESIEKVLSGR